MKEIELTQDQIATVDDDDYEYLSQWKWYARKQGNKYYAQRNTGKSPNQKPLCMHREIMRAAEDEEVDHKDGNGLRNQKHNLRLCTSAQNAKNRRLNKNNSTGYKGVSWHKRDRVYYAYISVDKKRIHLGKFENPIEAALVYDRAALQCHGEFACLNFPQE